MEKRILLAENQKDLKLLRAKSQEVKKTDITIKELVQDMFDSMRAGNGVGLSAVQIGVLKRIIVYEYKKPKDSKEINHNISPKVLINPEIIKSSRKNEIDEEGCLSFPDLYGQIKRSIGIRVKALNLKGKEIEFDAKGLEARIIQHEIDHLNGILFIDHLAKPDELYTYQLNE